MTEREKKTNKDLALLIAALMLFMRERALLLMAGEITRDQMAREAMDYLSESHRKAARLGSLRALGFVGPFVASLAERIAISQREFLNGFSYDLTNGRYQDTESGRKAIETRAGQYGKRLIGTANAAWLSAMQASEKEVRWMLGADENHCKDCLKESEAGWRSIWTLHRVPGDGRTLCRVNCKCVLETRSGARSFEDEP